MPLASWTWIVHRIAGRPTLVISDGTVKTHVTHVLSKLGVRDRVHPVILAYESGVITPGQAT